MTKVHPLHIARSFMTTLGLAAAVSLAAVLLAGCGLFGDEGPQLAFTSTVRLDAASRTQITVVVRNVSDQLHTVDPDIDARGELFNSAQQLLARFAERPVGRLAVDEEATIATWQGVLEPGTYLMRWTTPRYGGVELEFTLLKRFGVLEVGTMRERTLAPDPAASP